MPAPGLPRLRFLTALLAALTIVSVVPMVLSHWALIRINREALETAEKKYLTRSAVMLSADAGTYVLNAQTQLGKIADALKLALAVAPEKDPFIFVGRSKLLADYIQAEPSFLILRTLDRRGQGGNVSQLREIDAVLDGELRRAFELASGGRNVVGDAIRSKLYPTGGIVISVPVSADGQVLGVVEAFLSLQPIKEWLERERTQNVLSYIVDRRGNLVLASDPAALGGYGSLRKIELVNEFVTQPSRLTRSYVRGEGDTARRVLGTVARIEGGPDEGPDWGVIVETDEGQAYASVAQMTKASTVGAAMALVFAGLVAIVAARALSRPVLELVEKVRSIAEGDYGQRAEVRGTRELAQLSETFNSMSASLQTSIEKLRAAAKENQELFINSIRSLTAAIDAKDPYTRGHSERVARYAVAISKHFGLTPEEIKKVRIAALLHDVGKIGIDDRILRKPTALTDEEFEVMKTHPIKGAIIMGQIPQLKEIIPGIKHHHEKWDGKGYPDGLAGENIPVLARIVTVADTFDAMTTTRPYQKAMALDYVVSRIRSFSGIRFDPKVIDALEKAFAARDIDVVGEAARLVASA